MTQATIQASQITTESVQRRALGNKGKQIATGSQGKLVTCYNCRGQGHIARECKEKKREKDSQWFKDKALLMEAKEKGVILDAEVEAFLADVECTAPYAEPLAITTTTAFEVSHEDAYDSDVDEAPHAAAAFMANLTGTSTGEGTSNDTDFHSEVHTHNNHFFENMNHQVTQAMHQEEQLDSDVDSDIDDYDNIIPYHQYQSNTEVKNVPTEVSPVLSDQISMITILDDMRVHDNEDTLVHVEVSRTKMLENMKDPKCPIISLPINYAKLNNLYDTFVPQKELTREQAYWLPANEVASNQSKPANCFVHTCPVGCQDNSHLKHKIRFPKFDELKKNSLAVRIMNDSLRDENVSIKERFKELYNLRQVIQIVLWYLDSGCSRHMTGDRSKLINYVEKFIGTVRFGNDQFAAIVGYGDYKIGDTIITRVYYVEGLSHNLFSVGQFYDGDLEVAFRKNTCFIRNKDKEISLKKTLYEGLPKLKFTEKGYYVLHVNLGQEPMRVESINGIGVVFWLLLMKYTDSVGSGSLKTKDKTPEVIKKFIILTQRALNATVGYLRPDNGMEFVNKTLTEFCESVGITHNKRYWTHTERRVSGKTEPNSYGSCSYDAYLWQNVQCFLLWGVAVATACYTLNGSLVHTLHGKTYYELLKGKKPELSTDLIKPLPSNRLLLGLANFVESGSPGGTSNQFQTFGKHEYWCWVLMELNSLETNSEDGSSLLSSM
ncbi:reverse transcriptase domain-containing protein [Tanacetum coccineum]|uniref:Reverse transcriptase domain-containing protein n=1 Tax=Tanacetum coccineum TaxID=301880 RepID=A0ABQ5J6E3_9ASTR